MRSNLTETEQKVVDFFKIYGVLRVNDDITNEYQNEDFILTERLGVNKISYSIRKIEFQYNETIEEFDSIDDERILIMVDYYTKLFELECKRLANYVALKEDEKDVVNFIIANGHNEFTHPDETFRFGPFELTIFQDRNKWGRLSHRITKLTTDNRQCAMSINNDELVKLIKFMKHSGELLLTSIEQKVINYFKANGEVVNEDDFYTDYKIEDCTLRLMKNYVRDVVAYRLTNKNGQEISLYSTEAELIMLTSKADCLNIKFFTDNGERYSDGTFESYTIDNVSLIVLKQSPTTPLSYIFARYKDGKISKVYTSDSYNIGRFINEKIELTKSLDAADSNSEDPDYLLKKLATLGALYYENIIFPKFKYDIRTARVFTNGHWIEFRIFNSGDTTTYFKKRVDITTMERILEDVPNSEPSPELKNLIVDAITHSTKSTPVRKYIVRNYVRQY